MATLGPASEGSRNIQEKPIANQPKWPFHPSCFDQLLDYEKDVADAFGDIEKHQLSNDTSLYALYAAKHYSNVRESVLDSHNAAAALHMPSHEVESDQLKFFAASKVALTRGSRSSKAPKSNHGKLLLSSQTFRNLLFSLGAPVAFVTALARPYMVCGTGFRRISAQEWDHWCLIPVRTIAPCRVQAKDHTKSTAGSNQLDPFHYIHLSGAKADIRGSYIGIYSRHDPNHGGTTVATFSLLDSRLKNLIEEPIDRVRQTVHRLSGKEATSDPHFICLIYISSAMRWWNNVLLCFNQELVMHEKQLQKETSTETSAFSLESKDLNVSLHTMAAHLYRYKSELSRVEDILSELQSAKFDLRSKGSKSAGHTPRESLQVDYLVSQLRAVKSFLTELESKVQNILALLFNQIQVTNDRTMQAILTAAQEDNKMAHKIVVRSYELSQSMKNDSVAMKTIAILTMLFLPGTSFAAIFAMPFFAENKYLQSPAQVWIWTVLTVAFTGIAFVFFVHVIRGRPQRSPLGQGEEQDLEVGGRGLTLPTVGLSPVAASRTAQ